MESFNFNHLVVVFTETWLNYTFFNSEILSNKYNIYRRDRGTIETGGGVLIAVSSILSSEVLLIDSSANIEFIAVLIKLKRKKIFLTCSYIPPLSPQSLYDKHAESIKFVLRSANPDDLVIVLGDFNLPSIYWKFLPEDKYFVPSKSIMKCEGLFNNLFDLSLFQLNGILNDNFKLLDLIFVNETAECSVKRTNPISSPEDRHHPTIEININIPSELVAPVKSCDMVFCFAQSNYYMLNELLNDINWHNLLSCPTGTTSAIDLMTDAFYKNI